MLYSLINKTDELKSEFIERPKYFANSMISVKSSKVEVLAAISHRFVQMQDFGLVAGCQRDESRPFG